jgi:hypothetical protein
VRSFGGPIAFHCPVPKKEGYQKPVKYLYSDNKEIVIRKTNIKHVFLNTWQKKAETRTQQNKHKRLYQRKMSVALNPDSAHQIQAIAGEAGTGGARTFAQTLHPTTVPTHRLSKASIDIAQEPLGIFFPYNSKPVHCLTDP